MRAVLGQVTLRLDAAHASSASGDRAHREQPAGAPGPPTLNLVRRYQVEITYLSFLKSQQATGKPETSGRSDVRKAVASPRKCLKTGPAFLLCNEI
jgi:hypothetical protein